jgi:surface antigen
VHHQSHAPRRWSKIVLAALVLALVPLSAQLVSPRVAPRADAAGDLLCVGFGDCAAKGYSDSGYQQHWGHMYWLMYSGRNCVNYAAYRMVASGLPDKRPWSGSGNAMNWGKAMSSITNQTPVVGAVAWWKAYAPGAGSLGHVAYVERVVSPTQIIISESNWGSDFDWRVINVNGDWPSGFIHFNDKGVMNTAAPVIDGTPQVGASMSVSPGKWTPSAAVSYQWMLDGRAIKGKTAATYTPSPAALGHAVSVKVTASAKNYAPSSVTQKATTAIGEGQIATVSDPQLDSTAPVVDDPISLFGGKFTPGIMTAARSMQWYADGQPIPGATGWSYVPTGDVADKQLTAELTLTHAGYQDLVLTVGPTDPVLYPLIAQDAPGSVSGTATRGSTLTADPGTFADPTTKDALDADVTYQWLRGNSPDHPKKYQAIAGATAATYQPTTDDVGHYLAVRVLAQHKNYRPLPTRYDVPGVVTTASSLRVTAFGLTRAARIRVRLFAPGVTTLTGPVTVTVGKNTLTGQLVDGVAVLSFSPLAAGERRVVVKYAGTSVILPSSSRSTVDVKAPVKPAKQAKAPAKPAKKK